ncbi:MAG: methyltransferase domain-containing protein [Acidobacteria bacterium]|nr:methyltransferase domain-containing protein [Acidobacteriota bacterium]
MSDSVDRLMSDHFDSHKKPDAENPFEAEASCYVDYLQTFEGRLRLDLAWANLRDFIAEMQLGEKLAERNFSAEHHEDAKPRALDLGGGTGATALLLAAEGWDVVLLDSSAPMLALATEAARRTQLAGCVTFVYADAATAGDLFPRDSFDAAVCHNLLEYVEDARAVVLALGAVVRLGGVVSVLARNRAGDAMRAALKSHDLEAARHALASARVRESLYGQMARLFDAPTLRALVAEASLEVLAERGVRVLADYLPISLYAAPQGYERVLAFELELGAHPEFAAVARYTQILARRAAVV